MCVYIYIDIGICLGPLRLETLPLSLIYINIYYAYATILSEVQASEVLQEFYHQQYQPSEDMPRASAASRTADLPASGQTLTVQGTQICGLGRLYRESESPKWLLV